MKEKQAKIFKANQLIVGLKHELKEAKEEKNQLEDEIKERNSEIQEMTAKMVFLEYEKQAEANKQITNALDSNKVQHLQDQLEKCQDANIRRIFDLQKLRKSLNRLKNDLYVFKLSKKLQKEASQ